MHLNSLNKANISSGTVRKITFHFNRNHRILPDRLQCVITTLRNNYMRNNYTNITLTSTTLRNNLSDALDEVSNKEYLLIARGKKIAHALVNLDFLEDLLAFKNKKYLVSIKKARKEYKSGDTLTHDQVFGDL